MSEVTNTSVSQFRVLRAIIELHQKDQTPTSDQDVADYINKKRIEEGYGPARVGLKLNELTRYGLVSRSNRYQPTSAGLTFYHDTMRSTDQRLYRFQCWCDSTTGITSVFA